MKLLVFALFALWNVAGFTQEFKDNLFATLKSSTLNDFYKSEYSKMAISSQRKSTELGFVEETSTTFRKGKLNPNRINFSIRYSEYYVLEDRKKSLGKYEFNDSEQIIYYERTDLNQRNARVNTYKHDYELVHDVVGKEIITIVEYIGEGSVEVDTAMYVEYVNYKVEKKEDVITQRNADFTEGFVEYTVNDNVLVKITNQLEDIQDVTSYNYDASSNLVKMDHELVSDKGGSLSSETRIFRNPEGLVVEVQFYDKNKVLLEKKLFSYK